MKTRTPAELLTPAEVDHGLTLTHDYGTNEPRAWLHEVSYLRTNTAAEAFLSAKGYVIRWTGWVRQTDGAEFWTAHRAYPLSICHCGGGCGKNK